MGFIWGVIVAGIGLLFVVWGSAQSTFIAYRILVARSRLLWGDRVHTFYQVAGAMMICAGVLIAVAT